MNPALQDKLKLAVTVLVILVAVWFGVVYFAGGRRSSSSAPASSGANDIYLGSFTTGQNAMAPALSRLVAQAQSAPGQTITVRWQMGKTYPQIVFDPSASHLVYHLNYPDTSRWEFSGVTLDVLKRAQADGSVKRLGDFGASGGFIQS